MTTGEIDIGPVLKRFDVMAGAVKDATTLFEQIAGMLEKETEANFEAEGRPDWDEWKPSTKRERLKRNKGKSVLQMLQDRGDLVDSVSSVFGPDFAQIGAASPYAGTHQFGADINMPGRTVKTRLRTNAKGELLRQGTEGKKKHLAVFAKQKGSNPHKRFRESSSEVGPYMVHIPARPFLPISGPPEHMTLQPAAEEKVLDIVADWLGQSAR